MASTIETRARSYAYGIQIYGCKSERLISYEAGAKEQLAIDIKKACEWLKSYDKTFTETPSILEDFVKAMEK